MNLDAQITYNLVIVGLILLSVILLFLIIKNKAKKKYVQAWESRLGETIQHRSLKRSVSYKHLIKLEAYKLIKHIMNIDAYKPLKMYW